MLLGLAVSERHGPRGGAGVLIFLFVLKAVRSQSSRSEPILPIDSPQSGPQRSGPSSRTGSAGAWSGTNWSATSRRALSPMDSGSKDPAYVPGSLVRYTCKIDGGMTDGEFTVGPGHQGHSQCTPVERLPTSRFAKSFPRPGRIPPIPGSFYGRRAACWEQIFVPSPCPATDVVDATARAAASSRMAVFHRRIEDATAWHVASGQCIQRTLRLMKCDPIAPALGSALAPEGRK